MIDKLLWNGIAIFCTKLPLDTTVFDTPKNIVFEAVVKIPGQAMKLLNW